MLWHGKILIVNPKQRLLEYCLLTGFVWGMYLAWLIPFQLWWVGLEEDEFTTWLIWGTVLEMFFTYPITKMALRHGPKITEWCKNR